MEKVADIDKQMMLQLKIVERFSKVFGTTDGSMTLDNKFVVPEGYEVVEESMNGVKAEHLTPKNLKTKNVVLQFHGGGYVSPLIDMYRYTAVYLSDIAGGAEVYTIDYRIPPDYVYPAALEDGIAAYKYLLEKGISADNIILEGDSAGGNLIFVTALYLRDHNIPLPKLMIGLSPWTNFENNTPSRTENAEVDFILGNHGVVPEKREVINSLYVNGHDLRDPYCSPYFGSFEGFRNVLIQVGSYEILLDDSTVVAEKLKEAGANVKLTIYDGMFHTFQNIVPDLEESKKAWEEIRQTIVDVM